MRRRLTIGGAICIGLGMALGWSTGWFPFPGAGGGSGSATTAPVSESAARPVAESPPPTEEPDAAPQEPKPDSPDEAASPEVLHVLIKNHDFYYRLEPGGADYRPIALARLIELAGRTTGNEDDVRVRVSRAPSSRTTAEIRLREKLREAGLDRIAVYWERLPAEDATIEDASP